MRLLAALLAVTWLAGGPTPAVAWPAHGKQVSSPPPTCPHGGNPYCAGAPPGVGTTSPGAGSGLYQNANFFNYARQSGQAAYTSLPTIDTSCVDFACGVPASVTMTDPSVTVPSGCVYTINGSYLGGPGIQCFNLSANITINAGDFSLHGCLPLEFKGGNNANNIVVTITNSKFVNGTNCSNSGGVSGASGGLVRYDGTSNYTGNMSLVLGNDFFNGLAVSFPNQLDNLVTFNVPGTGTFTSQGYNVFVNAPGRVIGFGGNGGILSAADYVENFVYPPSTAHGEFVVNGWGTHPATQPSARYTYDTCLQGSSQAINGSTTCFYVTPGEAYGTITAAEVDHSVAISNKNGSSKVISATLAEVSYVTYTNSSFIDNWMDCTGATYCILAGASATFTNPTTFTGNTCLIDGSTYTAYNTSSTCGATP